MRCVMYILRPLICSNASETEATSTWRNPSRKEASSFTLEVSWLGFAEGGQAQPAKPARKTAKARKTPLARTRRGNRTNLFMNSSKKMSLKRDSNTVLRVQFKETSARPIVKGIFRNPNAILACCDFGKKQEQARALPRDKCSRSNLKPGPRGIQISD